MLEVKCPVSFSPVGHLKEFRKDPLVFLESLYKRYESIVSFQFAHRKIKLLPEATLVLATIVQRFTFELVPNHYEVKPEPLITLRPQNVLRMIVKRGGIMNSS
ncbi:hypothetical protein [Bacillus sp. 165]|uniref:hypothetical protein n=1 Tax=Bacillus sp. 165 TaxID=1529117 RepID=UPI001ADBEEEF|nr:hypothetical protein [Bacillus sp. 165]MBO9131526.1 hypothetical protein [Bacillus sp. 165]